MPATVRRGTMDDAEAAVETLRRSISELCAPDHGDDPQSLSDWLENKTVESWADWVAREDADVLVALLEGKVVGVGMIDREGRILLNYVHPQARFQGVSTALLRAMEDVARAHGLQRCTLSSTRTAEAFYRGRGYRPSGAEGSLSRLLGRDAQD